MNIAKALLESPTSKSTVNRAMLKFKTMEVHLNPEQEARLHALASRTGRNPDEVIEGAVDRILDYDEYFLAAVEEGRASARRGDLLEHDEVVGRIEQMLRW